MIVADTHALVWWVAGDQRLSAKALAVMNESIVGFAAITCWEIAQLTARGRLQLVAPIKAWWDKVMNLPVTTLFPITPDIAVIAASISDPIRDPADRLIVATALHHGAPLVTKDERIRAAGIVETIW